MMCFDFNDTKFSSRWFSRCSWSSPLLFNSKRGKCVLRLRKAVSQAPTNQPSRSDCRLVKLTPEASRMKCGVGVCVCVCRWRPMFKASSIVYVCFGDFHCIFLFLVRYVASVPKVSSLICFALSATRFGVGFHKIWHEGVRAATTKAMYMMSESMDSGWSH